MERKKTMICKYLPPQEYLLENYTYDAETGELDAEIFEQGNYIATRIGRDIFLVHRLIWRYMTGENPNVIDHINGHHRDNRWENLQNITEEQHGLKHIKQTNKCEYPGIIKHREGWDAYIKINYETVCIGTYNCPHKARQAQLNHPRETKPRVISKEIKSYIDPKVMEQEALLNRFKGIA